MAGRLTRRQVLKFAVGGTLGLGLAACGATPTPQVIREVVTQVVEREVTKIVGGTPVVEVVKETVVVEQTVIVETAPEGLPLLRFAMYNFDPWLQALPKMFGDFETEVGTAQVKLEAAPWDQMWTRFESQAAAGIAPDLQIGDPSKLARYAEDGVYLNVEPYIERDAVDLADWLPITIWGCRYDASTGLAGGGPLFGMPASFVGDIIYYNKDIFDAAGAPYPDDTWTRDAYEQAALRLTTDDAGKSADEAGFDPERVATYGCSTFGGYGANTVLWNEGTGPISDDQKQCWVDKPASQEIYQWLADMILTSHINPSPGWFQGQPDVFLTQKIAMKYDGTWNLDYYVEKLTFNWDIAPVVLGNKSLPRTTGADTNTLHIYSGTKYPDESWDLLDFMVGPGGQKYFMMTGTPCLVSVANSEEYLSGAPEHRRVSVDVGNYGRDNYPHLGNEKWKEVYSQNIEAIYLGEGTVAEVTARTCQLMAPVLDEITAAKAG